MTVPTYLASQSTPESQLQTSPNSLPPANTGPSTGSSINHSPTPSSNPSKGKPTFPVRQGSSLTLQTHASSYLYIYTESFSHT